MKPLFFGLAGLILLAVAARRFLRTAAVASAYKAKVLCSALFVSGLEPDCERAEEVSAESYALMRMFRARIDRVSRSVEVSFLGVRARVARFRPGLGATISASPLRGQAAPAAALPLDPARPWPEGEAPAPTIAALEKVLDRAFEEPDPRRRRRTRAVIVARGGRIVGERYAPGFGPRTPLNGWSMAKGALGALIGTLVADGRLSLSDRGLLAEWAGPDDPRGRISLEDLLRMRSGLRFSEKYSDPFSDVTKMLFDAADAGGYAASRPLAHEPGSFWRYASGTTNILSLIARRTVGDADYFGWPRRVLFDPLGMSSAILEPDASGTFVGSSFLYATARDWARLGLLHARDGRWNGRRVLPENWIRFITTPTPQSPDSCYGAHWWLKLSRELGGMSAAAAGLPRDCFHALGHEGQCLSVVPSMDLVVVRLGLSIDITTWNHAEFLSDVVQKV